MGSQEQYIQIASLPEDVRSQVVEFIEFLLQRRKKSDEPTSTADLNLRPLGKFKGKIRMSDDFDEPLEDFKDYM